MGERAQLTLTPRRFLRDLRRGVLAVAPLALACSSQTFTAPTIIPCGEASTCPNDAPPTQADVDACRSELAGPCAAAYQAYRDCLAAQRVCTYVGTTDLLATQQACRATSASVGACLDGGGAG